MTGSVKVAGLWELGWSAPLTEHDLWQFPLRDFGVDAWFMSPVSGIRSDQVTEVSDLTEVINSTDHEVVFVDDKGDTSLRDFVHPENALYVLGKAGQSPMVSHRKAGDSAVCIDTHANGGMLWPHQAISIILYDRLVKSWQ